MIDFKSDLALALIRIMTGIVFTAHGAQKIFGAFGGTGLQKFVAWLTSMGVPVYLGYAAAYSEFIGGLLLLLGIASRLGALMIIGVMVGAIYLVHYKHGFFGPEGFEYPLVLLVMAVAILIGGSGLCSLTRMFE